MVKLAYCIWPNFLEIYVVGKVLLKPIYAFQTVAVPGRGDYMSSPNDALTIFSVFSLTLYNMFNSANST